MDCGLGMANCAGEAQHALRGDMLGRTERCVR